VSLYRDPKGEKIFGSMITNSKLNVVALSGQNEVEQLKKRIVSLESTIKRQQVLHSLIIMLQYILCIVAYLCLCYRMHSG